MRSVMQRYAFAIVFVVFGGLAALMGWQYVQASADRAALEADLFAPYFEAVAARRFDAARARWSEARQQSVPLEVFARHYGDILDKEGPVTGHVVYGVNRAMFAAKANATVQLTLAHGFYAIVYEVEQQQDRHWRIATSISTTSNLRYKALPW